MTREEIIEHLDSIVGTYEILLGHGVNSDILDVDDIEAIKEAISALSENKGEWIPVSERLPEDSQRVNITIQRDYTVYVTTATWDEMRGYFYNLGHAFDDVVAWRELPEPYNADMRGDT